MKQCVTCLEYKAEEEYNWRYKHLNQRHKICRDCQNHHSRNWYVKHKEEQIERVKINRDRVRFSTRDFVWDYLRSHPCVSCGETDPVVLEFDHVRGKDQDIARMVSTGYSLEVIKKEIEKCQVLCANCHRRKTAKERGWFRNGT